MLGTVALGILSKGNRVSYENRQVERFKGGTREVTIRYIWMRMPPVTQIINVRALLTAADLR